MRHPFAPLGDAPIRTRAALRAHFASFVPMARGVERFETVGTVIHETSDPELVVAEFRYEGPRTKRGAHARRPPPNETQ